MDAGGVFAIIFAILFLVVGALYAKTFAPKVSAPSIEMGAITDFLSFLVLCMPNVFFVYGFIADIVGNKYHYSVASLTALCGMIINRVLGGPFAAGVSFVKDRFTKAPASAASALNAMGLGAVVPQKGGEEDSMGLPPIPVKSSPPLPVKSKFCSLPGFEWLENKIAPQGIIMSMTVLWYLMIEMWDTGQGDNSVALGVTTAITFALQWFVLQTNGCLESYLFGSWSAITALVMAITFAGTSYGVQKAISVPTVPPTKDPAGNNTCPAGYEMIQGVCKKQLPILVGDSAKKTETCSPDVGDGDFELVGELFKDGELITSSIVD